jgi:hypothetical protein
VGLQVAIDTNAIYERFIKTTLNWVNSKDLKETVWGNGTIKMYYIEITFKQSVQKSF